MVDGSTGRQGWRGARAAVALTGLVAVVGTLVSLGAGVVLAQNARRAADLQLDRRISLVSEAVVAETGRYVDTLRTVAAAIGAAEPLTVQKLRQSTAPLQQIRLAGATSISLVVPTDTAHVAQVQQLWRSRGAAGLVLRPHPGVDEHIFSVFTQSLDGSRSVASGVDVSQSAAPTQALTEARRSGQVSVSDTYHLIRDQGVPAAQRQMSFALAAPVYGPAEAGGVPPFRGWVTMGLRGQDFMGATLRRISQDTVDVTLRARNTDDGLARVAQLKAAPAAARDLHRRTEVAVAQRHWILEFDATAASLPGAASRQPVAMTGVGVALTGLLAALVFTLATGQARAHRRVRVATAELAASEAEARRQAGLLEAVMQSIGDGVGVVDGDGAFLLHNMAAKRILGVDEDRDGADGWQEHYGIFTPDGAAFPVGELPLARALAGESAESVEMVIRNAAQPEGVNICVSARPLHSGAGQPGAVAVFRDITDRKRHEAQLAAVAERLHAELAARQETEAELREQKAELTAFAGVVAHDLKTPLSAIAGYAEVLRDEIHHGNTAPAVLSPLLGRIVVGVTRMGLLIDDLLAYATARDGALDLTGVELRPLVDDVVVCHLDAITGTDRPRPDVYVGPMPAVHADAVMVRQLLHNLVGNAIKYTPPGQAARVDITARTDQQSHLVHLLVADRGIGIPDGQHEAIFHSFHRAHEQTSFPGTGLGLAICQRVVERHGGTITATDNPGGGTRFQFTLPAAASAGADGRRNAVLKVGR